MGTLVQDLRYALRMIVKNPGFTAVVVIAMALGIGVNTMIFSVVNAILLRDLPMPESNRLYRISAVHAERGIDDLELSYPDLLDVVAGTRSFEGIGAYYQIGAYVALDRDPERLEATVISSGLFPTLRVPPALGRNFTPHEEVIGNNWETVILSDRVWRNRFQADPRILGRTLTINGRARRVVGVMPPDFRFPESSDFWIPLPYDPADDTREARFVNVVGRLARGVRAERAHAELGAIGVRLARDHPASHAGYGLSMMGLHESWAREIRPHMILLMAAVGCVLLIACANVANLMLARASRRQREVSLRLALGASRGRVIRQLLTESAVLASIGGGLGVLMALWGVDLVIGTIPIELPSFLRFDIDGPVLLFTLAISMGAGLLFGLAPALHVTRTNLTEALKEGSQQAGTGPARGRVRNALVIAEVAMALVLLAGTGLMIRSFLRMQETPDWLEAHRVVTGGVTLPVAIYPEPEQRRAFFAELMPRVRALPGVRSAAATTTLPLSGDSWTQHVLAEGGTQTDLRRGLETHFSVVTPRYFETLHLAVLRGREFRDQDTEGAEPVVVVNASAAKALWPGQDPIGKRVRLGEPRDSVVWRTVVGVVADVRQLAREDRVRAHVYRPHAQHPLQTMFLAVRSDRAPGPLAGAVRQAVQGQDARLPFYGARTLRELQSRAVWEPRLYTVLMAVFATLALVIAALGIYGVMAYTVTQRTQEIGIRMALGADRGSVLGLVVGQGMRLAGIGLLVGLAGALAVTRLMASMLFGVDPSDPPTFGFTVLAMGLVALLACWLPARRAVAADPMTSLRYE